MKKLSIILLSSFFLCNVTAQETFLKKVDGEYKYGLKDKSGKQVTDAVYDEIGKFYDGIAKIKVKEKLGLIGATGKELASPKYDEMGELYDDMTNIDVKVDGKWGVIDLAGNELVAPKYNNPIYFGYASDAFISIIDPAGENASDKLFGVINDSYKEVISPKYTELDDIGSGYCKFSKDRINVKYGLLDSDGKEIFAMKYDDLFANSKDMISIKRNNKWFLLDKKENAISDVAYENVFRLLEGRAKVKRAGKYGFIDEKGNEVISCKYDAAEYFKTSGSITYVVVQLDGRKYTIDKNGNEK